MGILDLYEANSACDSSLEPSPHIKNIGVKKFSRRARRAPAARENVFRSLHKPPKNDCLETWIIKMS